MPTSVRHSLRALARTPVFSLTIILIIAIGVGANTAIFSVLRTILLRPLPFAEPDRIVRLYEASDANLVDQTRFNLSPQTWKYWREHNSVFTDVGRATGVSFVLRRDGAEAQRVQGVRISHNFFSVLGVKPVLGRDVRPEEDQPGGERVVLVSEPFWQRVLGGRAEAIGETITLDGQAYTVIGVLPKNFRHPYRTEVWVPFATAIGPNHEGRFLYAPARLKPGVTTEQARVAMRELCARMSAERNDPNNPRAAWIVPIHAGFVQNVRAKLLAISAAAAFLLLIVGTNFASLLLARHVERAGETSVRTALGASRSRLVREALLQSGLLAAAGSALGVLLAWWSVHPLYALSPLGSDATGGTMREFATQTSIDLPVLAASLGLTLLIGLGFGLVPALRGSRGNLTDALKGAGRSGTLDRGTKRLLGSLVVFEVAVAVVLLVATGLMLRSFQNLTERPWGFETDNRLAFDISFTAPQHAGHEARVAYVERALERLRALPGVASANATTPHLMYSTRSLAVVAPVGGIEPPQPRGAFIINHRMVFPGFFRDTGIRIVRGRALDETDRAGGQPVAVISEAMAKRFWPGEDAVGKVLKRGRLDDPRPGFLVVGVAEDIQLGVDTDDGDIVGNWYLPYAQNPNFLSTNVTFLVHGSVPAETLVGAIRSELGQLDSNLALFDFNTLEAMVGEAQAQDRFALLLVTLFGAIGLLLSSIGLYGLLSLQVARRTREIGVRTALGASSSSIVGLVMREGFALVLLGIATGFAAALGLTRVLQAELHDVSATDPFAYLLAATVLALAAALACWLPARRAARVDPMVALRAD
jgi:putative ABC transport system permease protein